MKTIEDIQKSQAVRIKLAAEYKKEVPDLALAAEKEFAEAILDSKPYAQPLWRAARHVAGLAAHGLNEQADAIVERVLQRLKDISALNDAHDFELYIRNKRKPGWTGILQMPPTEFWGDSK